MNIEEVLLGIKSPKRDELRQYVVDLEKKVKQLEKTIERLVLTYS